MAKKRRLEEILLAEGLIDEDQLELARAEQARTKTSLGRVLIEMVLVFL
jgi:hypothetical protein